MTTCLRYEDVYGPVITEEPAWNGGAVFIQTLSGDGYYSFQISRTAVGIVLGLTSEPVGEGYSNIAHGFIFSRGKFKVIENGVERGSWSSFSDAHTFHIVREDNVVLYCRSSTTGGPYTWYPGDVVYTSQLPSYGTVYLDASFYNTNDTVLSASYSPFPISISMDSEGSFSLLGVSSDGAYNEAKGSFSLTGSASEQLVIEFGGGFTFTGSATGTTTSSADGGFSFEGVCSDSGYNFSIGGFSLLGEANCEIKFGINEAKGIFQILGVSTASEYVPRGAAGSFYFEGKASDVAYGDAAGGFTFFGFSSGSRAELQNYFDVRLHFVGSSFDALRFGDGFGVSTTFSAQPSFKLKDRWSVDDHIDPNLIVHMLASDTASLTDVITRIAHALAAQSFLTQTSASVSTTYLGAMADLLASSTALSATADLHAACADALALEDRLIFKAKALMAVSGTFNDSIRQQFVAWLKETLNLPDSLRASVETTAAMTDEAEWLDSLRMVAHAIAAQSLSLSDDAWMKLRTRMQDAGLTLTAELTARALILQTLTETVALLDALPLLSRMSMIDALTLMDDLHAAVEALAVSADTLALLDGATNTLFALVQDTVELGDDLRATIQAILTASDTLAFVGKLPLEEGDFSAWVMNAETTGATSYANFPFNSLFTHGGRTFGTTETGLFELAGDTDDADPIAATIRTGDLGFGTGAGKNIPHAYLYVLTSGALVLKTISSRFGERTEILYELRPRAVDKVDDETFRRVQLCRGLRGVWWSFELTNVNGADFNFQNAEVLPVVLSRRG